MHDFEIFSNKEQSFSDDLAALPNLDETVILEQLNSRYKNDIIYTYIGDILLSINPFKNIEIYSKEYHQLYNNAKRKQIPPHVYALADFAYQGLKSNRYKSQCCVISGESGAGKTESTKLFLKHLMHLCEGNTRLEEQILQVNPLMEAFGNAKTTMNDNSSRFGKYIELTFLNSKVISGQVSEYLLEKSRVTFQNVGEQNFHIFYYLISGLNQQKEKYFFDDESYFEYLRTDVKTINENAQEFTQKHDELVNAMNYLAFTDEEKSNLFQTLVGILFIGNLKFSSNEEDYASYEPQHSSNAFSAITNLLGIETDLFIDALTCTNPVAGKNEFRRHYTLDVTLDARDASSKYIYSKLFTWIVKKINDTLSYRKDKTINIFKEIGILDIYGFEKFQKNSFEQLCINLTNEQIQYFFNKHIFTLEQEEYEREGICVQTITFNDNQPLLDLFISKKGILTKLDDICKLPRSTDYSIVENFKQEFSKNSHYIPSKGNDLNFSITHYAGLVTYTAENFLEKNRDTLPQRVIEIFKESKNKFISEIFENESKLFEKSESNTNIYTMKNINKTKLSVSAQYKSSLEILMKRMSESKPLFLRCIKPNPSKKPNDFEKDFVLQQLRYCGVLETTRIRKEGYALRPNFEEFIDRYQNLSPDSNIQVNAETCIKILKNSGIKDWSVGKTKVFLKYYHYDELQGLLNYYVTKAIIIQKYVRRWLAKRYMMKKREQAKEEENTARDFFNALHTQFESLFETFNNSALIKLPVPEPEPEPVPEPEPKTITEPQQESETIVEPSSGNDFSCQDENYSIANADVINNLNSDEKSIKSKDIEKVPFKQIENTSNDLSHPSQHGVKLHDHGEPSNIEDTNKIVKFDFPWFYDRINRSQAEVMLRSKQVGCFLVRKSDSRNGYSLSFRAENRCRHYMIDELPNNKYIVIGEPRVHNSLLDLIKYHQKVTLSNWNGHLTSPCIKEH